MGIGECIIAGAIFMVVLIVNHISKVKVIGKERIYKRELVFDSKNQRYQISTVIYFVNSCFIILIAYIIAIVMPREQNYLDMSGATSVIIMVISGSLSNLLYRKIITIWNKNVSSKKKLFYIGENTRTWTILIVSYMAFSGFAYVDDISVQISYLAFSIIFGKLFWIENKRKNIKKILESFFRIPYIISMQYVSIIYLGILMMIKQKYYLSMLITIFIVMFIFLICIAILSCIYQFQCDETNSYI